MRFSWIILTFSVSSLIAQERPLPPTRIVLPSDSVTVVNDAQKIEADSSRIELPEVLILGRDRSQRMVENKKNSNRELPRLLMPDYAPVSIWSRRDDSRVVAGDAAPARNRRFWAGLAGGSYASVLGDAGFWGRFPQGETRLGARLDRSNGAYRNSQHALAGVEAHVQGPVRADLDAAIDLAYDHRTMGAHGAALTDFERSGSHVTMQTSAEYRIAANRTAHGRLSLGNISLSSDTSDAAWRHSDHFTLGLAGDYTHNWDHWQLSGSASFERETLSSDRDSVDMMAVRNEIRIEAQTRPFSGLRTTVGLGWQSCATDSGDAGRLWALAQAVFMPNPRWGVTVSVTSGLTDRRYAMHVQANPYVAHVIPLLSDERPLALQLKAETRLLQKVTLYALVYHAQQKSYSYWERNASSGLFDVRRMEDVQLTELQLGGSGEISSGLRMQGSFSLNSDHLQQAGLFGKDDRLPYRPDYLLKGQVDVSLPWQLELEGRAELLGERRRGVNLPGRLPEVLLVHARLGRDFGRHLRADVNVQNLLNRDYVIWEGYREPGVQIFLGVRWSY